MIQPWTSVRRVTSPSRLTLPHCCDRSRLRPARRSARRLRPVHLWTQPEESKPAKARVITGLLYRHWKAWQEPTRSHILYVPLSGAARDLTPGAFDAPPFSIGGGDELDVPPDGKELVFARDTEAHPEISTNSDLFTVPVAGGTPKRITTRTGADTSPKYSPDGRWIAWRSQARAGYESDLWELWLYDRANGQTRRLAPSFNNWIESLAWAPDSKSIYVTAPHEVKSAIYEIAVAGDAPRLVWENGSADGITVSRDGKTLYFQASTLTRPADIYSVARSGGAATRLTNDNDGLLANVAVGATSEIWWTGAENAKVEGLVVKPVGFDPTKKYPLIVLIHGGPQGQWGDSWGYRWNPQMFAARGYVVLLPNPRGSTGRGQAFVEGVSGDWGGKPFVDIMNGVDAWPPSPSSTPRASARPAAPTAATWSIGSSAIPTGSRRSSLTPAFTTWSRCTGRPKSSGLPSGSSTAIPGTTRSSTRNGHRTSRRRTSRPRRSSYTASSISASP